MVDKYEIKNSTSCAEHGRLTYSDPSLMKISSSSMRDIYRIYSHISRKIYDKILS